MFLVTCLGGDILKSLLCNVYFVYREIALNNEYVDDKLNFISNKWREKNHKILIKRKKILPD